MLLFRSLTTGLLGACLALLVQLEPLSRAVPACAVAAPSAPRAPTSTAPAASIVDVAPGVSDVAAMVQLAPGERVIAVGDQPTTSDLAAGAALAALPRGPGRYLELTVATAATTRRVLVLMH